jgi:hypothetical protein
VNCQEVNGENREPIDDLSNLRVRGQRGNPNQEKYPLNYTSSASLHAKTDPPNATVVETVKIPFEKVGEPDTLESVVHNIAGP